METSLPPSEMKENILTVEDGIRLDNCFTYHAPIKDQPLRYQHLRSAARNLAVDILRYTPKSREQSLALTHLEDAIFWANASIARNESAQKETK